MIQVKKFDHHDEKVHQTVQNILDNRADPRSAKIVLAYLSTKHAKQQADMRAECRSIQLTQHFQLEA